MTIKTPPSSRRDFLKKAGLAGLAACSSFCGGSEQPQATEQAAAQGFDHPLGVQLYTLRDVLPQHPEDTIRALAEIGYREVEVLGWQLRELGPVLKKYGIQPTSTHYESPLVTGNWDVWIQAGAARQKSDWESALALANEYGLNYAVIAYLFSQERGSLDFYRRFADQMNEAGKASQEAGIQLCYHHHSFEFEPLEGQRPFDILKERFDADLVQWEMDVFWVSMGGLDPVQVLSDFSGRVPLIHLKDAAKGAQPSFQESQVPPEAFASVGSGQLDFEAILQAASEAGVQHYFVEQDHTPGNPIESLKQSYQFLQSRSL